MAVDETSAGAVEVADLVYRYLAATDDAVSAAWTTGEMRVWMEAVCEAATARSTSAEPEVMAVEITDQIDDVIAFDLAAAVTLDGMSKMSGRYYTAVDYAGPGRARRTPEGLRLESLTWRGGTFDDDWQPGAGRAAEKDDCFAELIGIKRNSKSMHAFVRLENRSAHKLAVQGGPVVTELSDGSLSGVACAASGPAFRSYKKPPPLLAPGRLEAGGSTMVEIAAERDVFETWYSIGIRSKRRWHEIQQLEIRR
jgi:hypothetical protein